MTAEALSKVEAILNLVEVPERHTFFQMRNFIIGKECTIQGQLWQVVRELRARRDGLEALNDQIEDLGDNIELADIRIAHLGESLDDPENKVLQRKALREKKSLLRTLDRLKLKAKYLTEEITYLVGAFEVLSKAEPIKPLDDIDAQRQYWNEKFNEELNLRILLKQPVDSDFVKTIMALEDGSPVKNQLVSILQGLQNHLIAEQRREKLAQSQKEALEK